MIDPRSIHVGSVVEKKGTGAGISPNSSLLSCQNHSNNAPYLSSIYTSLIPEGQEEEASGPSKRNGFSYIGERCIEKHVRFLSFSKC